MHLARRTAERWRRAARLVLLAYLLLVAATAAFVYAAVNTHLLGPPEESNLAGVWLILVTSPGSFLLLALPAELLRNGNAVLLVLVGIGVLQGALAYAAVSAGIGRAAASGRDEA